MGTVDDIKRSMEGSSGLGGFLEEYREHIRLPDGLPSTVRDRLNLLVAIERFEELFRPVNVGHKEAEVFLELIVRTWQQKPHGTYVMISMGAEYIHRSYFFLRLPTLLNDVSVLIPRLDEAELGEAIVRPGQRQFLTIGAYASVPSGTEATFPFAPEVVQRLQQAVAAFAWNLDHLPLLQHLLRVLWHTATTRWARENGRWDGGIDPRGERWLVSVSDLRTSLGLGEDDELPAGEALLGSAVETTAEAIFAQLPPREVPPIYALPEELKEAQRAAAFAFTLLATQGEQARTARRWTNRREVLEVSGVSPVDLDTALAAFVSPYPFLRDDGADTHDPYAPVDVSSVALLRNWPRFKGWLKRDWWARETYLMVADRCREWEEYRAGRGRLAALPGWWFGDYRLTGMQLNRCERLLEGRLGAAWAARYDEAFHAACADAGDDEASLAEVKAAQETRFAKQMRYIRQSASSLRITRAALPIASILLAVQLTVWLVVEWKK